LSAFTRMNGAKRNIPSRVTRLMRDRSWKNLCLLSNCFLGQPGTDSTEQCGGSSLGGVVSFYTVWQHPEVFGGAVCMSSTFSHKDDLLERVLSEPKRKIGFYLDSGWPGDNYEVTVAMALGLVSRGWRYGRDLLYLCFPHAAHDEKAWGMRLHLPMQLFTGVVARASRSGDPLLQNPPE